MFKALRGVAVVFLALVGFSSNSLAGSFAHSLKFWTQVAIRQIEPPLVKVIYSPAQPKQGEPVTAYLRVETKPADIGKIDTYLKAKVDGVDVSLIHPSADLWVVKLGSYSTISSHLLEVTSYVEDLSESAEIRAEIEILNQEITDLQVQIQNESDPLVKAALQAQMSQKIAERSTLDQTLSTLWRQIGVDDFGFNIEENVSSPDFPHLSQVSPGFAVMNGNVSAVVSGSGFSSQSTVFFSGVQISNVAYVNSNTLNIVIPESFSPGLKDVGVKVPGGSGVKNALLKNGFLVVAGSIPTGLTYALNPGIYTRGITIQKNTPQLTSGVASSFSINPSLPAGLFFNTSTGEITGTPTAIRNLSNYTITATNHLGSTSVVLGISVNDQIPSSFSYSQNFAVYTRGVPISANMPVVGGGANISSYTVSPALPLGLSLDPLLGVISGTPSELSGWNEFTVTAHNGSGSTSVTISIIVNDQAPMGLAYETSAAVFTKGVIISSLHPTNAGGVAVSYSVSPALPPGLVLNPDTGVIFGAPAQVTPATNYQITAKNSGGSTSVSINLTVSDVSALSLGAANFDDTLYGSSSNGVFVSVVNNGPLATHFNNIHLLSGNQFSITGGTCSSSTVLATGASCTIEVVFSPSSLGLKEDSLVIDYQNGAAAVSAARKLVGVGIDHPPEGLSYPSMAMSFVRNIAIPSMSPNISGGPVVSYEVIPALPAGLIIDPTTGVISGTPTSVSVNQDYVVVASNSGGSIATRFKIQVSDGVPPELSYQQAVLVYTKGIVIPSNSPINTDGMPIIYSVSPALPVGLDLDANTGTISGTPSQITSAQNYLVTASNAGASVIVSLNITVNDQAPINLTYSPGTSTYLRGSTISANSPSNQGGAIVSYSISPALPPGLILDSQLGIITGTPTQTSETNLYTITATNSGGSTSANIFITVVDTAPEQLTYLSNPAVYTKSVAIPSNNPSNTAGTITGYSVFPPLPLGLSLDGVSGHITGTPTQITPAGIYRITGTNSGGSTFVDLVITVNDLAPTHLTYSSNPVTYTKGTQISSNLPNNQGGAVVSYSISPALPLGLNLDPQLGMITGTPSVLSSGSVYTVTASNTGGSTTANLFITVNDVPPSQLVYSTSPAVYVKGSPITNNIPSSNGGPVVSYSVSPALPAGLSMNAVTGFISGTPTAVVGAVVYTVTASNSGGSTTHSLFITVNDIPPTQLTYASNPVMYIKNTIITNNVPSNTGGYITQYTILPALPTGLSLSLISGTISGTPTVVSASKSYVITGTNSGGSTQFTLTLGVNDAAPTALTYQVMNAVYPKDSAIANNLPSNSGGAIASYSVSPALPAGLSLNSTTGVISGTPTVMMNSNAYVVTGTNASGSISVTINIAVVDALPANLTYQNENAVYTVGQAILSNSPASSGGVVTNYSISPNLPVGLAMNPDSGVITGYPLSATPVNSYVITASNAGGSTTKSIQIVVNSASSGLMAIANADKNTCAVWNGALYCWGDNEFGQLGFGSGKYSNAYAPALTLLTSDVSKVAISRHHTCAVQAGALKCWGNNNKGQLGNNTLIATGQPQSVLAPLDANVLSVSVGPEYTCAIKTDSSMYCFGNLAGVVNKVPVLITPSGAGMVSTAWFYTCSVINGGAQCLGTNFAGQLGNGTTTTATSYGDVMGVTSGVTSIAGAQIHTCAVQKGSLKCWGANPDGELGDGTNTNSLTAVQVSGQTSKVAFVSNGGCTTNTVNGLPNMCYTSGGTDGDHTCSIVDGSLFCFGDNGYGEIGNGSTNNVNVPTSVIGMSSGVTTVAAAARHTCAIVSGVLKCWGANYDGQLGNGTSISSSSPVVIPIINSVPSGFNYSTPVVYNVGAAVSNAPVLTDGLFAYYTITPALSAGLVFNTGNGKIGGTPTAVTAARTYTVTGHSSNGTLMNTSVSIEVAAAVLPPSIAYSPASFIFRRGVTIDSIQPTNAGGVIGTCTSVPALPAGLSLNSSTCVISGTATQVVYPAVDYTITASNSAGSNSKTLQISVLDQLPTAFQYSPGDAVYTKGIPISLNVPSNSGGAILSYAITPALPAGLSMDPNTGIISGTPTAVMASALFTVTGINSAGSVQTSFHLTVNDVANLILSNNPNFPTTIVGGSSGPVQFTIQNIGQTVASSVSDSLTGSGFVFESKTCGNTLNPGDSCDLFYSFHPTSAGSSNVEIAVGYDNGVSSTQLLIQKSANALNPASIIANNPSIPDALVGAFSSSTFTITNNGQSAASVVSEAVTGNEFSITGGTCADGSIVPPGNSCTVTVKFSPSQAGVASGSILFQYQDGLTTQLFTKSISATGVAPALLSISEVNPYDFGTHDPNTSVAHSFTVTNTGGYSATLTEVNTIGLAAPFSRTGGTCAMVSPLAPNATCTIEITFAPIAAGIFSDSIELPYQNGVNQQVVLRSIQGTGTALPFITISDTPTFNYGVQSIGSTNAHIFTVTNTGGSTAWVQSNLGTSGVSAPFTYVGGTCSDIHLAPNATCTVSVSFDPTSSGVFDQSLTVYQSTGQSASVALHGVAKPQIQFVSASDSITEGASTGSFVIAGVSSVDGQNMIVPYTLTGTLNSNRYSLPTTGNITIASSGTTTVDLGLINDGVYQGDGTVIMTLGNPTSGNADLGSIIVETISVHDDDTQPPVISYSGSPYVVGYGIGMTPIVPSSSGGLITSCASTPALPAGLSLNQSTCAISGTPTALVSTPTTYNIVATGDGGNSALVPIQISVLCNGSPFQGGTGTSTDPFLICSAAQLTNINTNSPNTNINYKQILDINLSGVSFSPLLAFSGIYNGDGHVIANWTYAAGSSSNVGIFSTISGGGIVKNIGIANVLITGSGNNVGALVGTLSSANSRVENCYSTGNVTGGSSVGGLIGVAITANSIISNSYSSVTVTGVINVGGLLGQLNLANMTRSRATGNVSANNSSARAVGGLVGLMTNGLISRSYATGNVSLSKANYVGGLIGEYNGGDISNCYATGNVTLTTGNNGAGGLIGSLSSSDATISYCYSTGLVTGSGTQIAGFIGNNNNSTAFFSLCYWDTQNSGRSSAAGAPNAISSSSSTISGQTTSAMQTQTTFAIWNFTTVWNPPSAGNYPTLR